MDPSWQSTVEGLALGLGSASAVRALLDSRDVRKLTKVAIIFWFLSYFFFFGSRTFLSAENIIIYYCLHTVVSIYRSLFLYLTAGRAGGAYHVRHPEIVYALPVVTYLIVHIGWIALSIADVSNECLLGTTSAGCAMGRGHKGFRMATDIVFVAWILTLDIGLIYHLVRRLYHLQGMHSLMYHHNVYHGLLQLSLLLMVALNIYRIARLPSRSLQHRDAGLYPIWQVQDAIVLLLFTEFGCRYTYMLKKSQPDTSEQDLEAARLQLARTENAKNNLIRYLHHELRNNLQRMTYLSEQAAEKLVPHQGGHETDQGNVLEALQTCAVYINAIVEDVLTIENYESGTLILRPRRFNLTHLIQGELSYLRQYAGSQEARLDVIVDMPSSYEVMGDPDRVRQILRVLGESCLEHAGRERTADRQAEVEITVRVNGSLFVQFLASVTDIFDVALIDPYTLHPGEAPHDLSRSVVHRILKAVHGHIVIDASRKRAQVIIPLLIDLSDDARDGARATKKIKTLIVDDSSVNRRVLSKVLRGILKDQLILEEADDGQTATDLVLKEGHVFDIIWMDMVMPIKDGFSACHEIKSVLPTTIVVMVSANDLASAPEMHATISPDDALIKPVNRASVVMMLEKHKLL